MTELDMDVSDPSGAKRLSGVAMAHDSAATP